MKSVLMFPGQAELKIEAVSAIVATEDAFEFLRKLEGSVGFDWKQILYEGSSRLNQTKNAQLVQFLCSVLLSRKLAASPHFFKPDFLVGHSLGEYTALHISGAYDFATTAKLIAKRVSLLETIPDGHMAWVLGSEAEVGNAIALIPDVSIAAVNGPKSVNITGTNPDFRIAVLYLKGLGFKVKILPAIEVVRHSRLLKESARELADALHKSTFLGINQRIVAANSAAEMSNFGAYELEFYLRRQILTPVHWLATVNFLWSQGVRQYVECGVAPFLGKLVKKIYPRSQVVVIDSFEKMENLKL